MLIFTKKEEKKRRKEADPLGTLYPSLQGYAVRHGCAAVNV
jgi:hypothetical protein